MITPLILAGMLNIINDSSECFNACKLENYQEIIVLNTIDEKNMICTVKLECPVVINECNEDNYYNVGY